jgi:hypothetical protein
VSGRVIPLKKQQPASPESPSPWALGEVFTRDGVDYELVTAGEITLVELDHGERAVEKVPGSVLDLLSAAGALVGDHILVLRRTRPV